MKMRRRENKPNRETDRSRTQYWPLIVTTPHDIALNDMFIRLTQILFNGFSVNYDNKTMIIKRKFETFREIFSVLIILNKL